MSQSKPTVRGDYVTIRGNLHRVTGKRQAERVRDILDHGHTAPITRWDDELCNDLARKNTASLGITVTEKPL